MNAGELPFVGQDRKFLVDRLLRTFNDVTRTGEPRLVSLEAGPGWGKTRIIHEFYRQLASEHQGTPPYWPPSILDDVPRRKTEHPLPAPTRRKRIYPAAFEIHPQATPHWFWWGVVATARRSGTPVEALANDFAQIESHMAGLERRLREVAPRDSWRDRLTASEALPKLRDAVLEEGLNRGIQAAANLTIPGLGIIICAVGIVWQQRYRWTGEAESETLIDTRLHGREELVKLAADSLSTLAAEGIPTIIAVEDVHEADPWLVDFLVTILRGLRGQILVITTAWPGLLDEPGRPANRLISDVPGRTRLRITPKDLPVLPLCNRISLVRALIPDASHIAARALATYFPNPYTLELASELPRIREIATDPVPSYDEMNSLPRTIDALYRESWKSLPAEIRDLLVVSVVSSPESICSLLADRRWDSGIAKALLQERPPSEVHLTDHLDQQALAYAWVRRVNEWLRQCHEPAQYHVAVAEATDYLSSASLEAVRRALTVHVNPEDQSGDPERRRHHANLVVALASEGIVPWTEQAVDALDMLIAEAAALPDVESQQRVISLAGLLPTDPVDASSAARHHRVINAFGLVGKVHEAVWRARNVRTALEEGGELEERSEAHSPQVLAIREVLAYWLGRAGRIDEAIDELRDVLTRHSDPSDPGRPETLNTRNHLAIWLAEKQHYSGAIEQLQAVLTHHTDTKGAAHPLILSVRNQRAVLLGLAGRGKEAVAALKDLVRDMNQALKPDHPETLTTRSNLATWLAQTGRTDEAIHKFQALVRDQTRILGPHHPDTLNTRSNLATWLAQSGHARQAIQEFHDLVRDQTRIFGPHHPDTLNTRSNLATWLAQTGRTDEAIHEFHDLVNDQIDAVAQAPSRFTDPRRDTVWRTEEFEQVVATSLGEVMAGMPPPTRLRFHPPSPRSAAGVPMNVPKHVSCQTCTTWFGDLMRALYEAVLNARDGEPIADLRAFVRVRARQWTREWLDRGDRADTKKPRDAQGNHLAGTMRRSGRARYRTSTEQVQR